MKFFKFKIGTPILPPSEYFNLGPWRLKKGGGPIQINLIHEIGVMRFLISEISKMKMVYSNSHRKAEVEDKAGFAINFVNGAVGTFVVSDSSASPYSWENTTAENPAYPNYKDSCYYITGTNGSISYPHGRMYLANSKPDWMSRMSTEKIDFSSGDPLAVQLDHFIDIIEKQTESLVTAFDGFRNLEIIKNAE